MNTHLPRCQGWGRSPGEAQQPGFLLPPNRRELLEAPDCCDGLLGISGEHTYGQKKLTLTFIFLLIKNGLPYLSEPSLSTGVCEMPRLLEKSVLFEETLAKPFPPVTMDSESIKGNSTVPEAHV